MSETEIYFLSGRLEKPSFSLLGIMLIVSFGVLLTGNAFINQLIGMLFVCMPLHLDWTLLTIFTRFYHAVAKETEFNLWGFIFIMLAAVMAGFRWSMTQILLQVCYCIYIKFWIFFVFIIQC